MKAYEGLAIMNFYLGQLHKAEYYQDRFLRGKMENDKSGIKGSAIQFVRIHLEKKMVRFEKASMKNSDNPSS